MDEWLSKQEIEAKFMHISKHSLPFEGPVKDIIPQKGTDLFKDTWKFLKGLFYVTKDGYYFQYNDVCHGNINLNQEGQPYDLFLDGALRCAYSYSLTTSAFGVIEFLMGIISKGNFYVGKDRYGDLYFLFSDFCYTYLREKDLVNKNVTEKEELKCEEIQITGKKFPNDFIQSTRIRRRFGGFQQIGPYKELKFYDRIRCSVGFDGKTLSSPGRYLQIVAMNKSSYAFLDNNTFMPERKIIFNGYHFCGNNENFIWLKINSAWGLYNRSLSLFTIPPVCDDYPYNWYDDCLIIKIHGKYGVAQKDGIILLDFVYDNISSFSSTHYKVKQGDREWEIKIKQ